MNLFNAKRIIALIVMMLSAMTTSAMAQEMPEFDLNMNIGYHVLGEHIDTEINNITSDDDRATSLIGAASQLTLVGKYKNGSITLGLRPFSGYLVDRLYITYDIAPKNKVIVGLTPSEVSYFFGGLLRGIQMEGYGAIQNTRRLMARYHWNNLTVALVDGSLNNIGVPKDPFIPRDAAAAYFEGINDNAANGITWVKRAVPRLEMSYKIKTGAIDAKVYGQYGLYFFDVELNNKKSSNIIHTGLLGIGNSSKFGKFTVKTNIYGGINSDLTDAVDFRKTTFSPQFKQNGDEYEVQNTMEFGAAAELGYKINDKYSPHIGIGYSISNNSDADRSKNMLGAYVNVDIAVMKGLLISPEIAYYQSDESVGANDTKTGSLYYGVKFLFTMF